MVRQEVSLAVDADPVVLAHALPEDGIRWRTRAKLRRTVTGTVPELKTAICPP